MSYKWIGAILVIACCGGFGFSIAANHRRKVRLIRQLVSALTYMECELQYRLTPLPELCRQTGKEAGSILRNIFWDLASELDWQNAPDVCSCMSAAIRKNPELPVILRKNLLRLGHILGQFDLSGQLKGLRSVKTACREDLKELEAGHDTRLRSYQTLGLCAGAALVILFI